MVIQKDQLWQVKGDLFHLVQIGQIESLVERYYEIVQCQGVIDFVAPK